MTQGVVGKTQIDQHVEIDEGIKVGDLVGWVSDDSEQATYLVKGIEGERLILAPIGRPSPMQAKWFRRRPM